VSVARRAWLERTWMMALALVGSTAALGDAQSIIPAGEPITIHSEVLGEDRAIVVALPASYRRSTAIARATCTPRGPISKTATA
jgi:hypothetical protein